jgi:hypothetical protein
MCFGVIGRALSKKSSVFQSSSLQMVPITPNASNTPKWLRLRSCRVVPSHFNRLTNGRREATWSSPIVALEKRRLRQILTGTWCEAAELCCEVTTGRKTSSVMTSENFVRGFAKKRTL